MRETVVTLSPSILPDPTAPSKVNETVRVPAMLLAVIKTSWLAPLSACTYAPHAIEVPDDHDAVRHT